MEGDTSMGIRRLEARMGDIRMRDINNNVMKGEIMMVTQCTLDKLVKANVPE